MILSDANLLLYAYNRSAPVHKVAKAWLASHIVGPEPFGLSWATILAFVRICTNPRAMPHPLTPSEARSIVNSWLVLPSVVVLQPGTAHWDILGALLVDAQVRGPLVTDAHLAALAIEHGAVLHSTDQDFSRFTELRWVNPLRTAA